MIIINAKLKVSEEHREAYLDLMTNLVKHASEEEGNTFYSHYEDVAERNTFVVVENYKIKMRLKHITIQNILKCLAKISANILQKNQSLMLRKPNN